MIRNRRTYAAPVLSIRKYFFWLLFFFFPLLDFEIASQAQTPQLEEPKSLNPAKDLAKGEKRGGEAIWRTHRELWHKRDFKKSLEELDRLYQWKLNQGIRNYYPYAFTLMRESQILAPQERTATVLSLLHYAEKMAPDSPQVVRAKAYWLWKEEFPSGKNIWQAVRAWLKALSLSFTNLEEALPQLANFILLLFFSFTGVFLVFSFSLLFKYYSFCAHHWQHILGGESYSKISAIIPFLFFSIPFALGWGWMWLFIFWFLILVIYASRADRLLMLTFLLLLLLWPTGVRLYASFLVFFGGNGHLEMVRANDNVYEADLYTKILALAKEKGTEADWWHTRALLERRMEHYGEAEKSLLRYGELEPNSAAYYNNLGNIYVLTGRLDKAINFYQQAIKLSPAQAEIHYNLGQAYLLNLQLKEGEMQFQQARQLAPQLISYYTSISSKNLRRLVIDLPVKKLRLLKRITAPSPEREELAATIWDVFWGKIPLKYGEIALALVILAFILRQMFWGGDISIRRCTKCGRRICSRCVRSLVIGQQCAQCLHTFSSYSIGDPQIAQLKKAEVAKYQKRRYFLGRFLSRLLPGAGHIYLGHSGEGAFYLFLSFFLILKIIFWPGWIPRPWPGEVALDLSGMMIVTLMIIIFYLFVQHRVSGISLAKGRGTFGKSGN